MYSYQVHIPSLLVNSYDLATVHLRNSNGQASRDDGNMTISHMVIEGSRVVSRVAVLCYDLFLDKYPQPTITARI